MNKTEKIRALLTDDASLPSKVVAEVVGCTKRLVRKVRQEMGSTGKKMPKILIFDIETAPMECYTWGIRKQLIQPQNWELLKKEELQIKRNVTQIQPDRLTPIQRRIEKR